MSERMSAAEAQELFVDALDGALDAETQARFDAALREDAVLAHEYQELASLLEATQGLSAEGVEGELTQLRDFEADAIEGPTEVPDLLPKIQAKIRERTRGRYFHGVEDTRPTLSPIALGLLIALVVIVIVAAFVLLDLLEAAP